MVLSAETVKQRARDLGFDACGIAPAQAFPELALLRGWLARGYAGTMGYLPRTAAQREDVRRVVPTARAVIVTGTAYHVDRPLSVESVDGGEAIISRYAWGDDYHDVIGRRLEALLAWMRDQVGEPFDARAYVDTGPVQERVYAQYAGVGWVGKNGCLISPGLGSWLFLAEIVCSLPLDPDPPALDRCGTCALCLEACPTGALVGPRLVDATRCVSYLTIELRGGIPEDLRGPLGRHVSGCDVCQDVCPWNAAIQPSADPAWQPHAGLDRPRLVDLWCRTDDELARLVRRTAMTRVRPTGLRRNIAVALGNSTDPSSAAALDDASADVAAARDDPMVREHVRWARARARR
jgi:epoxyqueuosine reductase